MVTVSANPYLAAAGRPNRVSISRTVARPQLRETAPFLFTDYVGARDQQGNPDLLSSQVINADVRFEVFPGAADVVAVSAFFKRFNDQHGHLTGDACLRAVADRLVALAGRGGDRVYRYGGEEFAILLPRTGIHGAHQLANRIVEGFAAAPLQLEGVHQPHRITLSVGLAAFEPTDQSSHDDPAGQDLALTATRLIARADEALYEAKRAGRSRCVTLV